MNIIQHEDMRAEFFDNSCLLHLISKESNPIETDLIATKSITGTGAKIVETVSEFCLNRLDQLDFIILSLMLTQKTIISLEIDSTKILKNEEWVLENLFLHSFSTFML